MPGVPPASETWVRHLPNLLTLLRLLAVPAFCWLVVQAGEVTTLAGWVFIVAALTDFVDGAMARRWGIMSQFGKVADPLADRLLIGAAAVLLSVYDERVVWWAFLVVIWRDVLAVIGFAVVRRQILPDVSLAGKAGTALLMAGVAGLLLFDGRWPMVLFWSGVAMSLVALVEYVVQYRWVLRRGSADG